MAFWVYILRCADASYYTGHTDNLEQRLAQHHTGAFPTCYTFNRRPLTLVFTQDCTTREEALAAEQQIKGWSRKKKEAMMRGDWAEVSRLAQSKTPHHPTPAHPEQPPVRPEPVEGQALARTCGSTSSPRTDGEKPAIPESTPAHPAPTPVRPEPVEGQALARTRGSTSSPRTDGSEPAIPESRSAAPEPAPAHPEPAPAHAEPPTVRPKPAPAHAEPPPVRPELVEGQALARPRGSTSSPRTDGEVLK